MAFVMRAPNADDPAQRVILRDSAVNLLKERLRLQHASRRLITDLVDAMGLRTVGESVPQAVEVQNFAIIVVVEGMVTLTLLSEPPIGPAPSIELGTGVYFRTDPQFAAYGHAEGVLRITASELHAAQVSVVDKAKLDGLLLASPLLKRSFDVTGFDLPSFPDHGGGEARRGPRGGGPPPSPGPGTPESETLVRSWEARFVRQPRSETRGSEREAGGLPRRLERLLLAEWEGRAEFARPPSVSDEGEDESDVDEWLAEWEGRAELTRPASAGDEIRDDVVAGDDLVEIDGTRTTLHRMVGQSGILAEFIWLTRAPHVPAPLEGLAHLVAAAIARDFDEPTAVIVAGGNPEIVVWKNGKLVPPATPLPAGALTNEMIEDAVVAEIGVDPNPLHHFFFLDPTSQDGLPPARFRPLAFHRIVYVTDGPPSTIPDGLEALLPPAAAGQGGLADDPLFASFVPSIVVQERASFGDYATAVAACVMTHGASVSDFRVREIADGLQLPDGAAPAQGESRLHRDLCRLRFTLTAIEVRWNEWRAKGGTAQAAPFLDGVQRLNDPGDTSRRWARAITARRVGIALSGGGACAYRFGPLRTELRARGVPIDVFSGVSGGALIAAYECVDAQKGFDSVVGQGPLFWLTLPLVMLSTWPFEAKVNWDLDGARVEEMETRFVAVTAALPESSPPRAAAIVRGTIGEAVRASGTLPPPFAPTRKNGIRYTDGSAAAVIPAQVLRDYGADIVLAMNCVPGPERTNIYDYSLLGRLLYHFTSFGRSVDGWAWQAFQTQRTSRRYCASADVYVEFRPERVPFQECIEFWNPQAIMGRAVEGENKNYLQQHANLFADLWSKLGRP
jgi:hypothetical protein